jgi:pyruvate ferredoxin oxidoreductase gamma subunit
VFQGLRPDGFLLVNTARSPEALKSIDALGRLPQNHVRTVAATELAMKHIGRPVPNAALLGAFAALTGIVHLHSVATAIRQEFPGKVGEANIVAATTAHEAIVGRPAAA